MVLATKRLAALTSLLLIVLPGATAHGATVDVSTNPLLTITGAAQPNGLGDVNGDGVADIGVMASDFSAAYVVFGRLTRGTVDVNALGSHGFKITPAAPDHLSNGGGVPRITAAGDVNGDGRGDVLVAAPLADFNGRTDSGSAYVVFGRTGTTTVDLGALGSGGFRVDGPMERPGDILKQGPIAAAGDVGGDSRDDVIVGFRRALPPHGGPDEPGTSFVIYGGASGAIDTGAPLGTRGFTIAHSGGAVAGLRDFNGDGRNDVALASAFARDGHVVFGLSPPADRDVDALGSGGFTISDDVTLGGTPYSYSVGWTLDGGGDVNGDGRPDLAMGNNQSVCFTLCLLPRRAAVLFAGPSTANVNVGSIGSRGFAIDNGSGSTLAGTATMAGDVNADVRADILVGRLRGGPVLVYGKAGTDTVNLDRLGDAGVDLTGADAGEPDLHFDGVGDQDGDLIADVAVEDDPSNRVYVVNLLPGAAQQLAIIAFRVAGFGLREPLSGQLISRLTATRNDVTNNQTRAACLRLGEFTQFVASRNGNGLNGPQPFELVASAGRVSRTLGC